MRAAALRDVRPRADRARAVLAVRSELRLLCRGQADRDALPVAFVRLPETPARGAPVVELVEEPVADEIPRRRAEADRRRAARRHREHTPVHDRALPVADRVASRLVAGISRPERAEEVEAVARRERATARVRRQRRRCRNPAAAGDLLLDTRAADKSLGALGRPVLLRMKEQDRLELLQERTRVDLRPGAAR